MIRILRWVLLIAIGVILLTVAVANLEPVTLRLLPDSIGAAVGVSLTYRLPLFAILLAAVLAGIALGFVWEWFRESKHRSAATHHRREAARLEREVGRLRDKTDERKDDVLALLEASERPR